MAEPADLATTPVLLIAAPGVLLLDLAGVAEPFRIANEFAIEQGVAAPPFALQLCAADSDLSTSLPAQLSGLQPLPSCLPAQAWVIVVGTASSARLDARRAPQLRSDLLRWLEHTVAPAVGAQQARLWTVCSGALLAAEAGLFDGRRCTTHHALIDKLQALRPQAEVLQDRIFVIDGPVASSAGITAGIDLALAAIQERCGVALATQVARDLVVYWRRAGADPQLSPLLDHRNHLHPAVHRAQDAILASPAEPWSLPTLAAAARVSTRHLRRLFQQHAGIAPLAYLHRVRVALARQLLQTRHISVELAADQVGFSSARQLRDAWKLCADDLPAERKQTSTRRSISGLDCDRR